MLPVKPDFFHGNGEIFLVAFTWTVVRKEAKTSKPTLHGSMLLLDRLVRERFSAVKSPHSKQSWLIQPSSPHPGKMILPTAQEHLGMFSTNVITASGSGEAF